MSMGVSVYAAEAAIPKTAVAYPQLRRVYRLAGAKRCCTLVVVVKVRFVRCGVRVLHKPEEQSLADG
jgi:hypothetical protein